MEALVTLKATPQDLDVLRRALGAHIAAQREIGSTANVHVISDGGTTGYTPQQRRAANAEATLAAQVLEGLQ